MNSPVCCQPLWLKSSVVPPSSVGLKAKLSWVSIQSDGPFDGAPDDLIGSVFDDLYYRCGIGVAEEEFQLAADGRIAFDWVAGPPLFDAVGGGDPIVYRRRCGVDRESVKDVRHVVFSFGLGASSAGNAFDGLECWSFDALVFCDSDSCERCK